jgi:kinesin family protein 5
VQAMKIENMVRIKEEFDYKSLCRTMDMELEKLIAENERQGRLLIEQKEEFQEKLEDAWTCASEAEKNLANAREVFTFTWLDFQ